MAAFRSHRFARIEVFQVLSQGIHIRFQTSDRHLVISYIEDWQLYWWFITKTEGYKELNNSASQNHL